MSTERFEFAGFELEGVPLGPGTGSINGINEETIRERLDSILVSPAVMAVYGSIGNRFNSGNSGSTFDHDSVSGITLNSMGLPGLGIDLAAPIIAEYAHKYRDAGKLLMVSLTTFAGQNAKEVLPELVDRTVDASKNQVVIEINYSCPNAYSEDGTRKPLVAYDPLGLVAVRATILSQVGEDVQLQEKLAPYVGEYKSLLREVAGTYRDTPNNVGVSLFNTILGESRVKDDGNQALRFYPGGDETKEPMNQGGMSGPVVTDSFLDMQDEFVAVTGRRDLRVIGTGGVMTGADVKSRTFSKNVGLALSVTRFMKDETVPFGKTASRLAEEYLEVA